MSLKDLIKVGNYYEIKYKFLKFAEDDAHARSIALMKFLSGIAKELGIAEHVYVVGGAVRNYLIGQPIKDIDVVIDSVLSGYDSEWFAEQIAKKIQPVKSKLTTNNYGVAILSIDPSWVLDGHSMLGPKGTGETIEIANARKESYGGSEGKGYKPHSVETATIEEDLLRREFTFNTLLWRLSNLAEGPEKAEVLDLLGRGKSDLSEKILRTPADPDKTFSDDPTRMLRAIKFVAKYNFKVPEDMLESIRRNAFRLNQMPWNAVRNILIDDILKAPNPRRSVMLLKEMRLADALKEMIESNPEFKTSLGRSFNDNTDPMLLLDLLDLDWDMKTPISFLNNIQQERLRELLLEMDESDGREYVKALIKPPVDLQFFFKNFNIPEKERKGVISIARDSLLENPNLLEDLKSLTSEVESKLGKIWRRND
jgi:tRNA nucleotidyltransferase/poly(A) polymerase